MKNDGVSGFMNVVKKPFCPVLIVERPSGGGGRQRHLQREAAGQTVSRPVLA